MKVVITGISTERMEILTGIEVAAVVGELGEDVLVVEVECDVGKEKMFGNDSVGNGMPAKSVSTNGLISGILEGIGIGRVMSAGSRASRACRRAAAASCLFTRRFACAMVTCHERGQRARGIE